MIHPSRDESQATDDVENRILRFLERRFDPGFDIARTAEDLWSEARDTRTQDDSSGYAFLNSLVPCGESVVQVLESDERPAAGVCEIKGWKPVRERNLDNARGNLLRRLEMWGARRRYGHYIKDDGVDEAKENNLTVVADMLEQRRI